MQQTLTVNRPRYRQTEKAKSKRHERATRRAMAYLSSRLSDIDLEAIIAIVESKNR